MVGSTLVLAGFVVLLVGTQLVFSLLAALNVRYRHRAVNRHREWVTETLGVDDPDELLAYTRVSTALGQSRTWAALIGVLLVFPTGLFGEIVALAGTLGLPRVVEGTAVIVVGIVLARVAGLPFDAADTFGVEEAFGFNEQGPRLWVRDLLIGLAITVALTTPLVGAVLWLLVTVPTYWWIGAWAVLVAFSLLMLVLYPRVIAPLFNDFEPVAEGELREAVESVFARADVRCEQIYEMDASRRSSHSNAYFVGFGRTKRVVLFDTLIEQLSIPALQAVLAHELAHWKRRHIWVQLGSTALRLGVLLAILGWLVEAPWLQTAFGIPASASYGTLVVAAIALEPLARFTAPIENRLSLRHEREADAYALDVMGDGTPMVEALTTLAGENLSNPFPHPWYAAFHYSHPPVPERIRAIREEMAPANDDADSPAA